MKLEDAVKQDFSVMTPQQKSHLRKRLLAAGMPIPPGLESKHGAGTDVPVTVPAKDDGPYRSIVVDSSGALRTYDIEPESV